jgi:hypothetical protein
MTNQIILNKDLILQANDQVIEKVDVPEWGGSVYVRSLSGTERDAYEASIIGTSANRDVPNLKNVRARLAVMTICDESGKRLFSDDEAATLGEKNTTALLRVYVTAQRLSGLTSKGVSELLDDLKKGRNGDSTSD